MITGLAGYRNEGPFDRGNYCDLLSAAIMINNDRILGTANLLLMSRDRHRSRVTS